jgi:D-alanyl-D-alanine carboxypeptidase/D-alanyl-D-alanine-endopeptidase (penicillin-binding protein 4)
MPDAVVRALALVVAMAAAATPTRGADPPLQAAARALVGEGQGVYAEAGDGTILASQAADRPVHPASVTKVASSLALLEHLGPEHRFETRISAGGDIRDGRVLGDLVIDATGDPTLVYENVFLLLARLRGLGVRGVAGHLTVRGPLLFNWKADPRGDRVQRALAGRDGFDAWASVRKRIPSTAALRDAGLAFEGVGAGSGGALQALVVNRSPPLVRILKWLNDYSNNVFHLLSDRIGGPAAVQASARAHIIPEARGEVIIDNAAGAGETNRMSPRVAVAVLQALERELAGHGLSVTDALPVSGVDRGTLESRLLDHRAMIVGKTGTFGDVGASALVGVARTRRWGRVTFAILNSGVPVPEARQRQDAFVRALLDEGGGLPWPHRRSPDTPFVEAKVE